MALKIRISRIGALDMKKFGEMPDVREKAIEKGSSAPLPKSYKSNEKAALLHPEKQTVQVSALKKVTEDMLLITLKSADGKPLAPFRPGQYISVSLDIDGSHITRPYSICSSPKDAYKGIYQIMVQKNPAGFAAPWMFEHLKVGDILQISGPEGNFYYEPLRDSRHVLALAGGSGITPFLSMARAIENGTEDFSMTLLFGNTSLERTPFRKELEAIEAATDKFEVVYVLLDEEVPGAEKGFLTADLIQKYSGEGDTVFSCGPQAMYRFLEKEVSSLNLDRKHYRPEMFGAIKDPWNCKGYPKDKKDQTFTVTLKECGNIYRFEASAAEPLLCAFERAGIKAPSRCRSGECGWCRSRLIEGEVFIPEETDGRRYMDRQYNYIHPCASYPLSDLTVKVPGEYLYS